MKTRFTFITIGVSISISALAHPRADEFAVVEQLVHMIMSSPEWEDNLCPTGEDEEMEMSFQAYDDLFSAPFPSNVVGSTWTPSERRAVFENFVNTIPELSTNGLYKAIKVHGAVALGFCYDHGASNVLNSAMRILSSEHAVAHGTALEVFEDLACPTDEVNDYIEGLMTNKVAITQKYRGRLIEAYAQVLAKHRTDCQPDSFTNGVSIVVSAVSGRDGAIALDKLLLDAYPDYMVSSNRFAIAMKALADEQSDTPFHIRFVERYFVPVTNKLMNATHPLLNIEELRGL